MRISLYSNVAMKQSRAVVNRVPTAKVRREDWMALKSKHVVTG
jgi:hypothetical protein